MKDWIVPVVVALLTGGVGSAILPLVQAMRGRGRAQIDAVDALGKTAREWVDEFKAEAIEARAELRACRQEAHALADEIRQLRLAILHPHATIDGLRELVRAGRPPGENGAGVNLNRP